MALALSIVGALICFAVMAALSRPATTRSRERAAARRAAFVAAHPEHAKTSDLLAALRHDGVGDDDAQAVLEGARARGLSTVDLWNWFAQFGADAASIAALTSDSSAAPSSEAARHRAPTPRVTKPEAPEVFEPGQYPGLEVPVRRRVSLSDNVKRERRNESAA